MKKYLVKERDSITNLIRKAFLRQGYTKRSRVYSILKCDWDTLKYHIENQFDDQMTWENRGKFGWHVDHVIPLYYAKNKKELLLLNRFVNLQPLWCDVNLSKGKTLNLDELNPDLLDIYNRIK